MASPEPSPPRALLATAGLAALLALAAWARLAGWKGVIGETVVPVGSDAPFHLRRILLAASSGLRLPAVDPWLDWPVGAVCPWADGFDVLGAAFARAVALGDPARLTSAAALFPVALGLLAVWATVDLARLLLPAGPLRTPGALAAGLAASVASSGVVFSQLGAVDHHVAETLSMLLLAGWALRRFPSPGAALRPLAFEAAGAGAVTFALWTFTGGPLYVALATVPLVAAALLDRRPALVGSGAPGLAAGALAAAALQPSALPRPLSFQVPTALQAGLALAAAGGVALAVLAARRRASLPGRLGLLGATVAVAGAAVALAAPRLVAQLAAGLGGWLLVRDPWLSGISEFQPVVWGAQGLRQLSPFLVGPPALLFPFLAAGTVAAVRAAGARGWAFTWTAAALAGLTLLQTRFGRVLSPFACVASALAVAWLASLPPLALRAPRTRAILPALAVVALAAADPFASQVLLPKPPAPPSPVSQVGLDLALVPPPAPGAVLALWEYGHAVGAAAGRPAAATPFGHYVGRAGFVEAQSIWGRDREALDRYLGARQVAVVVATATVTLLMGGGEPFAPGARGRVLDLAWMASRPLSTLLVAGSGFPSTGIPHLDRLMPRYASAEVVGGLAFALPVAWTFERVEGAVLRGRAAAGTRVVVEIPFRERGRPHTWRGWSDASADGNWALRVPVPTGRAWPTLVTGAAALVRVPGRPDVTLPIPEAAVRSGETLEVR